MADNIATNRLQTLAEVSEDDYPPTGDTVELEEMQINETAELKQLLSPADNPATSDVESEEELEVERDWTWVA